MESTKRLRYLSDEQVDALFRIVFAHSPTTLSPNDMWELRRIGLISDNELQNTASYWLMRSIVLAEPMISYYELIVRVSRLTFSTGSRVRNIISRDVYGESISKLRETLKSK